MSKKSQNDFERFASLDYESFKELAKDASLSNYERIGFPDSYRKGHEVGIFNDILSKLGNLRQPGKMVVDIGCGCSDLPRLLMDHVEAHGQKLFLVDSEEMLQHLPERDACTKVAGKFPQVENFILDNKGRADVILVYSLLHYVFVDAPFNFLDAAVSLLAPQGEMLIGDIPNVSKRKRFFASDTGVKFHKSFMKTDLPPDVSLFELETEKIDDGVLFGLMHRYRSFGYETYLLPIARGLPFANRREDLLIIRN